MILAATHVKFHSKICIISMIVINKNKLCQILQKRRGSVAANASTGKLKDYPEMKINQKLQKRDLKNTRNKIKLKMEWPKLMKKTTTR